MISTPERPPVAERPTTTGPTIPIAEIFGPTLQGEGQLAGKPTYFLRVGGCDFSCAWCDSGHAVNPEEVLKLYRLTQDQIYYKLLLHTQEHHGPQWLTISGGNPGLYDLGEVVRRWQSEQLGNTADETWYKGKVAVETQGSRWQPWFAILDLLTVSPKGPSSGMTNSGLDAFMREAGEVDYLNL